MSGMKYWRNTNMPISTDLHRQAKRNISKLMHIANVNFAYKNSYVCHIIYICISYLVTFQ